MGARAALAQTHRVLRIVTLVLLCLTAPHAAAHTGMEIEAHFAPCHGNHRVTCIVDGDTFWLSGTKIRIADINAPETSQARCASERKLGTRAARRMAELLNIAPFTLVRKSRDEDRYGRKLRIVLRGGTSLGDQLVREGLAEHWTGKRRNWC